MSESTKRKYSIEVLGEVYQLVSDESEDHLASVGSYVDGVMREIARKSATDDTGKIAVLAALQMASKLICLERDHARKARESEELMARIDAALQVTPAQRQ